MGGLRKRVEALELHNTLIRAELAKIVDVLEKMTDNQLLTAARLSMKGK